MLRTWSRFKSWGWLQWLLAVTAGLYVVYIGLAYLYLPGKLKQVVEVDVGALIERDISVERFAFNPFTLALDSYNLSVPDQTGQTVLAWRHIHVNFSPWRSLFTWSWYLQALELNGVAINIEQHQAGFNFSSILTAIENNTQSSEVESDTAVTTNTFALKIQRTSIAGSYFNFADLRGDQPANLALNDITMAVQDLYFATGDEHLNPFNVRANLADGGAVSLEGQYRVDPLFVEGTISADAIKLAYFSDFLENQIPVKVSEGNLALATDFRLQLQQELQLVLNKGELEITQLALDDAVVDPPMVRAERLAMKGLQLDLQKQTVHLDKLEKRGVIINQWLTPEGTLRYQHLLAQQVVDKNQTQEVATADNDWSLTIDVFEFNQSQLNFIDQSPEIKQKQKLVLDNLTVESVNLTELMDSKLVLNATLNDTGKIKLASTLSLVPFAMQTDFELSDISLANASDYVTRASFLRVEEGSLALSGTLDVATKESVQIAGRLDLSLSNIAIEDLRTGHSILGVEQLNLQQIQFDVTNRKVKAQKIQLKKPHAKLVVTTDQQLNLGTLIKAKAAETSNEESKTENGWALEINKTEISNGNIGLVDESVNPTFKTQLSDIRIEVGALATRQEGMTPFSLQSSFDGYAPFTLKGELAAIEQQPGFTFKSKIKGVEMPRLTPYSGTYIGNEIRSGRLNLSLDYSLKDRHLRGKNNIVANQLYLGKAVASEQAIDAPVALGLALLRDHKGVIDVDVNVAGELDDPGFSVSGIIIKAFVNLIVKAATSPFKMLGSLVGGGEDLGELAFTPGSAQLSDQSREKLKQLVSAFEQRPQLALKLVGNASLETDGVALKEQIMQQQIAKDRKVSMVELLAEIDEAPWWMIPANQKQLRKRNADLDLLSLEAREQRLQEQQPELKDEALEKAVYQAILMDLIAQQNLLPQDVLALADSRALQIKQYLVGELQFNAERVVLNKAVSDSLTGAIVKLDVMPL